MGLGRSLVAYAQTPILSKPGKRSFDYPALAAEAGAVGSHSFCDQRPDLLAAECLPMRFRVVAAVGEQHAGRLRGLPTTPRIGGIASTSGSSWVTSCALAPVSRQASGMPLASVIRWCLLPSLRRSTGLGPVFSPPKAPAARQSRADRPGEVEASGGAEMREEALVQCLEHTCLLLFLEAPPAGHTGAVSEFLR